MAGWGALAAALLLGAVWLLRPAPAVAPRQAQASVEPHAQQGVHPTPDAPAPLASLLDGQQRVVLRADGSLAGLDSAVADELRQASARALRGGWVEYPRALAALRGRDVTFMGTPSARAQRLQVLAPLATRVRSPQPVLRWSALPEARAYVVSIYDEQLEPQAASGPLHTTEWKCPQPLARGRTYLWQVAALTEQGRVLAPAPPEPEARFQVLAADASARLEQLLATTHGSPLATGVALAQAGVVDEAERLFAELVRANPGSAEARRLLEGAQAARGARGGRR